jgi:ElaB/YqjD/DUF883 family membrane-anchored ribosome-binding protein
VQYVRRFFTTHNTQQPKIEGVIMSQTTRLARDAASEARSAAIDLKDAVQSQGGRMVAKAQNVATDAAEAVKEKVGQLRDTASDYVGRGRAKLESAEQSVEEQITKHPIVAVLIGMGIGLAIGVIVARR